MAKYNVQGVTPRPQLHAIVGTTMELPVSENTDVTKSVIKTSKELTVPEGYFASRAYCHCTRGSLEPEENRKFHVRVGTQLFDKTIIGEDTEKPMDTNSGRYTTPIPVYAFSFGIGSWALNIEVLCERTQKTYREWQLATYEKVISAYNLLKAEYDNQVAQAKAVVMLQTSMLSDETKRAIERLIRAGQVHIWQAQQAPAFSAAPSLFTGSSLPTSQSRRLGPQLGRKQEVQRQRIGTARIMANGCVCLDPDKLGPPRVPKGGMRGTFRRKDRTNCPGVNRN